MYSEPKDIKFAPLGAPRRVWAVSSIHGENERLARLHDHLYREIRPGDRVVYLGNYGGGPAPAETVDELLLFRRSVLALPGMMPEDIIYLRGAQEELWRRLLDVPFAPDPARLLPWLLDNGPGATLESYGLSCREGLLAAREGVLRLTRWIGRVREAVRRRPGHDAFSTAWRRAAFTAGGPVPDTGGPLLFVNAGFDPSLPLEDQGDNFWRASGDFNRIDRPCAPFQKIIRGFDPQGGGVRINCVTATLDGGCGFGGNLVCAGFDQDGNTFHIMES